MTTGKKKNKIGKTIFLNIIIISLLFINLSINKNLKRGGLSIDDLTTSVKAFYLIGLIIAIIILIQKQYIACFLAIIGLFTWSPLIHGDFRSNSDAAFYTSMVFYSLIPCVLVCFLQQCVYYLILSPRKNITEYNSSIYYDDTEYNSSIHYDDDDDDDDYNHPYIGSPPGIGGRGPYKSPFENPFPSPFKDPFDN